MTAYAVSTRTEDLTFAKAASGAALSNAARVNVETSIIIVSHNSLRHLDRCLASVGRAAGPECEVILLDNASSDGSADYTAERFPWVRLVRMDANLGFAAGNNRAARLAQGRYLVLLNPDTEVTPGWLEALLGPLQGERKTMQPVGLTTARILMMDAPGTMNTCGNTTHYTGITVCRGLGLPAHAPELSRPSDVSAVSGACFAIRRELWDALGGFDEEFFTYLEDTDLSLRARFAGYQCLYTPDAVVYHSYTNRFSEQKLYYLERNRALMLLKCFRGKTLLLMLPALALAEGMTWGYAFKSGRGHVAAKLRAYGWLASNTSPIRRKRQQTQSERFTSDMDVLQAMTWWLSTEQLGGGTVGQAASKTLNPLFRIWYRVLLSQSGPN